MICFKKFLRTVGLILLIVLALSGIGIVGGPMLPRTRQDFDQKEVTIELVEENSENDKT
ncbi:MAG TPA: hypothetical protein PL167_08045 [Cyclobacteriaceae bacterium]|nr:hypothetical protein [Cyclobacteriaceae bacterium]